MFYVYLMRSEAFPEQRYIGFTTDLKRRIATHNAGGSVHTSKYKPWKLIGYHAFAEKRKAQEFEHYLKTGSGKAFANKRFCSPFPERRVRSRRPVPPDITELSFNDINTSPWNSTGKVSSMSPEHGAGFRARPSVFDLRP